MWRIEIAWRITARLDRMEKLMSELRDALAGLPDQLAKVRTEIAGQLEQLRQQLADAGHLSAEDAALIDQIKGGVQTLDDIVPDPAPETPAEGEGELPVA